MKILFNVQQHFAPTVDDKPRLYKFVLVLIKNDMDYFITGFLPVGQLPRMHLLDQQSLGGRRDNFPQPP